MKGCKKERNKQSIKEGMKNSLQDSKKDGKQTAITIKCERQEVTQHAKGKKLRQQGRQQKR